MRTPFSLRASLLLPAAALALAACGGGLDARDEPRPASGAVALEQAARPGDACGTAERPCVLREIRVEGAAAE